MEAKSVSFSNYFYLILRQHKLYLLNPFFFFGGGGGVSPSDPVYLSFLFKSVQESYWCNVYLNSINPVLLRAAKVSDDLSLLMEIPNCPTPISEQDRISPYNTNTKIKQTGNIRGLLVYPIPNSPS